MTAEADIAAIQDGGANTAAEVRAALTSILYARNPIDVPPGTPNVMDDEGDGNGPTWTWYNQGTSVLTPSLGGRYLAFDPENGDTVRYVYQTAPATPWEFTSKIGAVTQGRTGNFSSAGIIAATSAGGTFYHLGNSLTVVNYHTASGGSYGTNVPHALKYGVEWNYVRIAHDGSDLELSYSQTGDRFDTVVTVPSVSIGVVGLGIYCYDWHYARPWLVDWFRRTA